jgi:ABC-type multidrug transport system ATPase subunit
MNKEIAIAWIELTFKINPSPLRKEEKIILNDLNGAVNFGSLFALMGATGAGKTTLLRCINGKYKSGLGEKSRLYLNSKEKIRSCFITQHENEHLIMCLTAKQNLIYASKLKNSGKNFNIDHENSAMNLLSELIMSDIANTKVKDCSLGDRKRLTIALEMINIIKPNLLCIDEPTTGLDIDEAEMVMFFVFFRYSTKLLKHYIIKP